MPRRFESPRFPGRLANSADFYLLMGQTRRWPAEGLPARQVQGIKMWVAPLSAKPVDGSRRAGHRVLCQCPTCGATLSAGRLVQHKCGSARTVEEQLRRGAWRNDKLGLDVNDNQPLKQLGDDE